MKNKQQEVTPKKYKETIKALIIGESITGSTLINVARLKRYANKKGENFSPEIKELISNNTTRGYIKRDVLYSILKN